MFAVTTLYAVNDGPTMPFYVVPTWSPRISSTHEEMYTYIGHCYLRVL